jgi:DNA-binding MarR family transcriptional regulator
MNVDQSAWLQPIAPSLRIATRIPVLSQLTMREIAILATLDELRDIGECGPLTTHALAEIMGVGKPVITRSVTRLAVDGLVINGAHPKDKRKRAIALTEQGVAIMAKLCGERIDAIAA